VALQPLGEPGLPWAASPHVTEHLRPFLGWLLERHAALGGITEIRIIGRSGCRGVWSAFLRPGDEGALVDDLAPTTPTPRQRLPAWDHPRVGEANIYFSLQAVRPDATRAWRGFRRVRTTTRDRDVLAYTIMAVDIDPVRQPPDQASTDAEKAEALAVAEKVRSWLAERGVSCMLADSGNGWHLLVPLTPAWDDEIPQAARDARTLLHELDRRFSTPGAKVDRSTFNPSRILKLYGTVAVKGSPSPERPHRYSGVDLSDIPEDVDLFGRLHAEVDEGLEPATGHLPAPATRAPSPPSPKPTASPPTAQDPSAEWQAWRAQALDRLPLDAIYGELLTGRGSGESWLQCRDPASASGDRNPSAGVADGSGEAERGSFHSFRSGETRSVFDFLIAQGRATDFQEACALVSRLSGVPLPVTSAPPPVEPSALLASLRDEWPESAGDERHALLRRVLSQLLPQPALEQRQALEEARAITGLPVEVMRKTMKEVRREARRRKRQDRSARPAEGRLPVVDYVQNRDRVESLFGALVRVVRGEHIARGEPAPRFFRADRDMVHVRRGTGPVTITERNLAGLLSSQVELRLLDEVDDELIFRRFDVLPGDLSRAFVHSPRVLVSLPALEMYARAPLFDREWRFVGRPGYHAASGIYYDGPGVQPRPGVELLLRSLADFHWKQPADLVNFVGALLTALTMPHWGRGHPFLAINGNKPGVGKSTLARVLGAIVEGTDPHTVSFGNDEAELEKQLATRIEAGDRIIVIDNARTRRAIESAVLERCVTDTRLSFRRLGSNTAISRPHNDVLFCLTMNLTQMGADLRRRALPLNLDLDQNVREIRYPVDDLVGWVLSERPRILGELAGLVQAWVDAGRPGCDRPARHSTSQRWAATIDAILRFGGFGGFLTNLEASEHAFDERYQLMLEVVRDHWQRPPAAASQWAEWLADLLEDRFRDRHGQFRSARARATIVGTLFRDYLDTRFTVEGRRWAIVREHPDGATHPPTWAVREVPD
jgi:hypothetical protein